MNAPQPPPMGGRTTEVEIRIGSPVSFNLESHWIKRQNPDFEEYINFLVT